MLQQKVLHLISENQSIEALNLLIHFFGKTNSEHVKDFVQLKAQVIEIQQEKKNDISDPNEYKKVHNRVKDSILQILPNDSDIFKIDPSLLERLDGNIKICRETNTYFYTTCTLLAILQVPASSLYKCIEQYKFGSFEPFYLFVKSYLHDNILCNPGRQPYKDISWFDRDEFKNAMHICIETADPVIDDKKLFLGIVQGNSTTRQLLTRFFDLDKLTAIIVQSDNFHTP
jgi:hypothetical protein